jgi:pimeloyl-ACP methyl ester carboxylesterase
MDCSRRTFLAGAVGLTTLAVETGTTFAQARAMEDRAAARKLDCPVLVLWPSAEEVAGRPNRAEIWKAWADDVTGAVTTGGHLQPEDRPEEVTAMLVPFETIRTAQHPSLVFRRADQRLVRQIYFHIRLL